MSSLTKREVLELVRDCSSQEWQQPDGKLMGATDNQGRRLWFISEDVMQAVRHSLVRSPSDRGGSVEGHALLLADRPGQLGATPNETGAGTKPSTPLSAGETVAVGDQPKLYQWAQRCRHPGACIKPQCGDFCYDAEPVDSIGTPADQPNGGA
jgi:hypothetical protein